MARPLRIQFPGAIYHVMARGNGRQLLFYSDDDYQRMLDGLEQTVLRTGWEVFAFVWMPILLHELGHAAIGLGHPASGRGEVMYVDGRLLGLL